MNWTSTKTRLDDWLAVLEGFTPLICLAVGLVYHWVSHGNGSEEGEKLARDVAIAGLGMLGSNGVRYAREQLNRPNLAAGRTNDDLEKDLRDRQMSAMDYRGR